MLFTRNVIVLSRFPSTYDFVADTLVPTGNPNEFAYTGETVGSYTARVCKARDDDEEE